MNDFSENTYRNFPALKMGRAIHENEMQEIRKYDLGYKKFQEIMASDHDKAARKKAQSLIISRHKKKKINKRIALYNLWLAGNQKCYLCNKPLLWESSTVDHVFPKSTNRKTLGNILPTHLKCNEDKADSEPAETVVNRAKEIYDEAGYLFINQHLGEYYKDLQANYTSNLMDAEITKVSKALIGRAIENGVCRYCNKTEADHAMGCPVNAAKGILNVIEDPNSF